MDVFTARCPGCTAAVALPVAGVRLLTPADPARSARAVFTCPVCGGRESLGVDVATTAALRRAGAPTVHGHPSLGPPRRVVAAPPFVPDDLLVLHELLDTPDWFERLLAVDDASPRAS